MKIAKESLELLLRSLPLNSYFNIVSFGSTFEMMYPESVKLSEESLSTSLNHISKFSADLGGTEIE